MGRNSVKRQYKRQSKRKQNRGKKTKSRMSARQSGGVGGGSDPDGGPNATRHDMSHHCTWGNRKYEGKLAYLYCWCGNKRRDPGNDAMDWELQRQ